MVQCWRLRLRWHRIHFESSSAARSSSFIACLASSIQDGLIKIHVAVSMAKSLNRLPWYVWILCLVLTFEFSFPAAACMQPSKGHKGGGSFSAFRRKTFTILRPFPSRACGGSVAYRFTQTAPQFFIGVPCACEKRGRAGNRRTGRAFRTSPRPGRRVPRRTTGPPSTLMHSRR